MMMMTMMTVTVEAFGKRKKSEGMEVVTSCSGPFFSSVGLDLCQRIFFFCYDISSSPLLGEAGISIPTDTSTGALVFIAKFTGVDGSVSSAAPPAGTARDAPASRRSAAAAAAAAPRFDFMNDLRMISGFVLSLEGSPASTSATGEYVSGVDGESGLYLG